MRHMVVVYVGFVGSMLFAPVWLYLILKAVYEVLGLCVLDVAPEEVAGGIKHHMLLMYLEVHSLNDHETLDMAQGKDKGSDMPQAVSEDFAKGLFQSLGLSC